MRPRHIAAENIAAASAPRFVSARFNEAAAYSRGKPLWISAWWLRVVELQ